MNPTGLTVVGKAIAPIVDAFSSRGPSAFYPDVLKPDLVAPGVNILGAWEEGGFKIASGTSMSCPHISSIAAIVRSTHPTWSPAAIRSALMTTASTLDNSKQLMKDAQTLRGADPFVMGAGEYGERAQVKRRTVTNVGGDNTVYKVRVKSSPNVKVSVEPDTLVFKKRSERASYNVTFESKVEGREETEYGHITWKCIQGGAHIVRSPVSVLWIPV